VGVAGIGKSKFSSCFKNSLVINRQGCFFIIYIIGSVFGEVGILISFFSFLILAFLYMYIGVKIKERKINKENS
jgi:hypothetical protein